jgi:isoleucyl-tRNA synthetase
MVSFPIVGDADNAALVAWTTTPWTLPSNLALCVNANLVYAKVSASLLCCTFLWFISSFLSVSSTLHSTLENLVLQGTELIKKTQ